MYAEVAVDTYQDPTKKLFTYQIPPEFKQTAKEGDKVTVPFGKRTVGGYIWKITSIKPRFPTKPIQEVKSQMFTAPQVKLAHWMATRYLGSPLECLKCQ